MKDIKQLFDESVVEVVIEREREEGRQEGWQEGRQEGWQEGRQEGWQEGRKEGRQEEKIAIARNFKHMGISVEQIAKASGLSESEVAQL